MIILDNNSDLVINKGRHKLKTTNEFDPLNTFCEELLSELTKEHFALLPNAYKEQNYYKRSIIKDRHGKGLFCLDLVSVNHSNIGLCITSGNDSQISLYLHVTLNGIPVIEITRFEHHISERAKLQTNDLEQKQAILNDLINEILKECETIQNLYNGMLETKIPFILSDGTPNNKIEHCYKVLNDYRCIKSTNSATFCHKQRQASTLAELFNYLCDDMLNGKGIINNDKAFTKPVKHIRKRFILGQAILKVVCTNAL